MLQVRQRGEGYPLILLWLCCPFLGKGPWFPKPLTLALETLLSLVLATSTC